MAKSSHYIDNKRFLEEITQHRKAVKKANKAGDKAPGVTDYIGQCFLDIANNLAKKPNFANYSFKEEMVGDAVENCIMYATNFDPAKSKNPFAFFTQITFYAFLRRIQKEKKQLYIKLKCYEESDPTGKFRNWMDDGKVETTPEEVAEIIGLSETDMINFNKEKKEKLKKRRKRKNKTANNLLDDFMDE